MKIRLLYVYLLYRVLTLIVCMCGYAKPLQLCLTLSDPMDCSPPGSSVHWIFLARVLEWGAIAFSTDGLLLLLSHFSRAQLCATPWTAAHQAPLSMGFSRQEYWSGLPVPSPCSCLIPLEIQRLAIPATP